MHNLFSSSKKKLQELVKMEKKSQKLYPTGYNLLTVQDLLQGHYQILLIILLKEFIKLNVNADMRMKDVKLVKLNTTRNATRCNNRDDLLHLSFILKISIFSEANPVENP